MNTDLSGDAGYMAAKERRDYGIGCGVSVEGIYHERAKGGRHEIERGC
jgi:hypothetical protein